ncbi:fungal hydrophobin [Pluteus cervinus]|uniref:Fungal hydrophobin n=1 Tax=Pluteus cervinus TaxID=181527 RepID=A0ACD3AJS5_9AGAR|nr:fungal hydrophobin [Pluteus cervinus]
MFHRISAVFFFLLLAFPFLTAAQDGNCNTGPIQCCNSVQNSTNTGVTSLLGTLGIVLGEITGLIGFSCSPLSILGGGGNSCSAQPVCCTNNQFNGLINLGCSPININL